jgi:ubiquinol-cytochrome c reductase cytochrome c1 subunit
MVRLLAFLVGLFFSGWLLVSAGFTAYEMITEPAVETAEHKFHKHPDAVKFAHDGVFGKYDKAQLQRGLKVYQEVCAACHSLSLVSFRDFAALGYNEAEIKALAKGWATQAKTFDAKTGDRGERPNLASDKIPTVFYAGEGVPPDLSLITKARHNGPAYVYSLLMGYADPKTYKNEKGEKLPKDNQPGAGLHFNPYFPNLNLAMAAPITADNQVTYDDKTKATKKQMAMDVSAFLTWTAEPKMENRKTVGWAALLFLIIFTTLCYMSYQTIWADKKKKA